MHETGRGSVRDSVDNGETRDRRERRLTPTASTPVLFDTWTGTRTAALRSTLRAPRDRGLRWRWTAFATLLLRRHLVHTRRCFATPPTRARTRWRFGRHTRFVLLFA